MRSYALPVQCRCLRISQSTRSERAMPVTMLVRREIHVIFLTLLVLLPSIVKCLPGESSSRGSCKYLDVVIVGAGFSGIGAAAELYSQGLENFIVLEAKNYVGGRTIYSSLNGSFVPLGAGWIHDITAEHPIWALVQKYGMDAYVDDYKSIVYRNGENGDRFENDDVSEATARFDDAFKQMSRLIADRVARKEGDISVWYALAQAGWTPRTPLEQAITYFKLDFENGIRSFRSCASAHAETGDGIDAILLDNRGYPYIARKLSEPFSNKVELNRNVVSLKRMRGKLYEVKTQDGSCYRSTNVIITVSPTVLLSDKIDFCPPIPPWKRRALSLFPLSHYCKIWMQFPRQFWDQEEYILISHEHQSHYTHFQNFNEKGMLSGKNILLLTVTDDSCVRSQGLSDEKLIHEVMHTLQTVYGKDIPYPSAVLRSNWTNDPFTLGSYSYQVPGFVENDFLAAKHPVGRIWFAGEYLAGKAQYGTVHGALHTGTATAKDVLACMREGVCPGKFKRIPVCQDDTFECRARKNGVYEIPIDDHLFLECTGGQMKTRACPAGALFDGDQCSYDSMC